MKTHRLVAALALLAACGDLEHQNPFDPQTPTSKQARATLSGQVELESLDGSSPVLAGVQVSVAGTSHLAVTDASGHYAIPDVPPGNWAIQAVAAGYDVVTLTGVLLTLDDGGREHLLPTLSLPLSRGDVTGIVALTLPNGLVEASGGASVSLDGLAGAQLTDPTGSFLLTGVPIGIHQLSASRTGFLTSTTTVAVTRNAVYDLGTLEVDSDPGAIEGRVQVVGASDSFGALVRARGTTLGGTPWESSATSAADGSYLVSGIPAGAYTVTYEMASYGTVMTSVAVSPGTLTDLPPVDLVRDNGSVYGVATREGASDHAGIQVLITANPPPDPVTTTAVAVTDGAGNWRADGLPVGDYSIVFRSQPGYDDANALVTVAAKRAVPSVPAAVQLAMRPATLSGRVLLEGRSAPNLDGTTVSIEGLSLLGQTASDGSYLLTDVPAGTWQVRFERSGFDVQKAQITIAAGELVSLYDVTLAISRGALAGAFALDGMASSAGIVVTATGPATASTVTASDGSFTLGGLPVGTYSVAARKDPDWQPASASGIVVSAGLTTDLPTPPASLSPVATASVGGKVLLEAAASHGSTSVTLSGSDFRGVTVTASTATAADGSWSLGSLVAGSYQVAYAHDAFDTPAPTAVSLGTAQTASLGTATLAASRGAAGGTVVVTGAADASGTLVSVSGGPDTASTVTDAAGTWSLSSLRVGTGYVATFHRAGYASATSAPFAVTADATTAVPGASLSLDTRASLTGVATVERPVGADGDILVALSGVDLNGAAVSRSATTGPAGDYTITGLPQGTYALTFSKDAYRSQVLSGIFVAVAAPVTADAVLLPVASGTIAGTIDLSAGSVAGFPVGSDRSGVVVTLDGVDVPVPPAVTDVTGSYRFPDVPVSVVGGSYTVTARAPAYRADSAAVTAAADATVTAPTLTLVVDAGALAGTVLLRDAVGGGGDNALHAGTTISLTGTAFNGTSWSAAGLTGDDGSFTVADLPPGSYDVMASDPARTCGAIPSISVPAGGTATAPLARCLDAIEPGAVALGAPAAPAGGQSGFTDGAGVVVPIATPASDGTLPTANFRGYEWVVGSAADWAVATRVDGQPATLTFSGLVPDAVNTLWVRAVDWIGNAGPVATAQVVSDTISPPAPTIATPRAFVDATTTSVTLSGSESDANFAGYETCYASQPPASACAATAPAGCGWIGTSAAFAISLTANERTCLYARAYDRAGNRSPVSSLGAGGVVSDLIPPSPPTLAPSYDPTLVTIRAPWVDFFVTGAATDSPAGGAAWQNVAWLEVDAGAGFEPLCPAAACRPGDTWTPCGCGCTDARLLCDGSRFVGIRAPILEGSRNTIAVRAVDIAGNAGSGVGQQVGSDSRGDILAATSAIEGDSQVRGRLIGYTEWYPGGTQRGMLVDLGADRRFDPSDPRCFVVDNPPTGYDSPVFPVGRTLVVGASYTSLTTLRPGPDDVFCSADDVSTTLLSAPAGYNIDGVTGFGERVAWWDRQYSLGIANVHVREPGADGLFGNVDDTTATFSFNYVDRLSMGERVLLVKKAECGIACYTYGWRAINAGTSGSWQSGTTIWDLPPAVRSAALSADGGRLAWIELVSGSGTFLKVREAGANRRFDAADDEEVSVAVPWSLSTTASLVVDGPHVVALANGSPISWLIHWWAGPDGRFGTGDDALERIQPSGSSRSEPSLAASYLTFSVGSDVLGLDLSVLRWEVAPTAGLDGSHPLDVDGRGWLLYKPSGQNLVARSPFGLEATAPFTTAEFAVDGTDLIHVGTGNLIQLRTPDAAGDWFSAGAPAAVDLYAANAVDLLRIGGGKGLVVDHAYDAGRGTDVAHYRILEPGTGTLATFPAKGSVVDVLADGMQASWAWVGAITAEQVFYPCHAWGTANLYLCVHDAGVDGIFGTADDPLPATYASAVKLMHPTGSPRAGLEVYDARAVQVDKGRMILSEFSPPAIYLFDAGPDGRFNTADDRGRKLADISAYDAEVALAGDWSVYLDTGSPAGRQVWLVRGLDGAPTPVTEHYSAKTSPVLERSGRAFWVDSVFVPEAVFVRAP